MCYLLPNCTLNLCRIFEIHIANGNIFRFRKFCIQMSFTFKKCKCEASEMIGFLLIAECYILIADKNMLRISKLYLNLKVPESNLVWIVALSAIFTLKYFMYNIGINAFLVWIAVLSISNFVGRRLKNIYISTNIQLLKSKYIYP